MKYAYKNGKILNGTKDMQVQTGLTILTEGEKIAAIVPEEMRLSGYTKVDLQGKYIMPGLINMHVHLAGNGKPQKKQRDNAKLHGQIELYESRSRCAGRGVRFFTFHSVL